MSTPYRICPDCGSHLDPGERCECQSNHSRRASGAPAIVRHLTDDETNRAAHASMQRHAVEAQSA